MKYTTLLKTGAAFIGLAAAALSAPVVSAASLEEALLAAYENNPTLLAQRASLRATDETYAQAASGWRPTVAGTGSLGATKANSDNGTTDTDSDRSFYSAGLSITQSIYDGGSTEASLASADASILAARATLDSVEQSILLSAATAYMDVLRDAAVLELNYQNEKRLEKQLEATRDRFEVGEVTRTDVAQAESSLAQAQADRIAAAGTLEISKAAYVEVVGEEIDGAVPAPILNLGLPDLRNDATRMAVENNPSVIAAQHSYETAQKQVDVAFSAFRPNVDVTGSASYNNETSSEDLVTRDTTVTLSLTVPIYQAGLVSSQVREARQSASEARLLIEETKRGVVEAAASSWENLKTTRARIVAQQDVVRATAIAFEGVEQEAIVGSRTVLEVLDAEQELLNAKVNLVQSQRDEYVAQFTLLSAIGGMTIRNLGLENVEIYDQERYYDLVKDAWYGPTEETISKP